MRKYTFTFFMGNKNNHVYLRQIASEMKRLYTYLILTLTFSFAALAQVNQYAINDTTSILYQKHFGTLDSLNNRVRPYRYVVLNPNYYKLFVPLTFYSAPINQITDFKWTFPTNDTLPDLRKKPLPFDVNKYFEIERTNRQVNNILVHVYADYPKLVQNTEERIQSIKLLTDEETVAPKPKTSVLSLFKPDEVVSNVGEAEMIIHKPNFWTKGGEGSLQFTQNYISDNWYKGGESTNTLLTHLKFSTNYDDKQKVQFENLFEARVGFNTVPSDTIREYRINTDVLRISSKLGVRAFSKFYYTLSAEFNTQFFNNYKANSNDLASAFLAPANLTASIGMDYKLQKPKLNLSVMMLPLSYNLRYVGNDKVDETAFGLEKGDKTLHDFGSKFQTTISWKIIPSITYDSRLYYFTSYEKVEAEWENTINFVLNRYLSTKLFAHVRYDDGVKRVDDHSYFQFTELLSFGINYKW